MANEKRTLVELSPHGVQLLSVSGRTITGWLGRGIDAKDAVAEFVQAAEGVPFALFAPKQHAVLRGEGDAAGASAELATALGEASGGVTSLATDAASGRGVSGTGAWFAVGAPNEQVIEAKQALAGLGIADAPHALALSAHVGAVIACLQASGSAEKVAIWAAGENASSLTIVSAMGVKHARMVPLGQAQVTEAVQLALGLKFKTAAQKLFANEGYDFSTAAKKVGEKLSEGLAGSLKEAGGAALLHVVGFSASQSSWLVPALAEAMGIGPWTPDLAAWLSSKGWTLAGDVTLSACAAGVLGAAVQADAWIVAAAPAAAPAAPVKPEAVPAPVTPTVVVAPAKPASEPVAQPPKPAAAPKAPEPAKPAPVPAKVAAPVPAPKAVAPVKPGPSAPVPATAPKPAAKPVVAPVPASVPASASSEKAPATIGGVPVPFVISGVVLSLLVGVGVFFVRNKGEPQNAQTAPTVAQAPAAQPVPSSEKPESSLTDLLAPPPVPGLPKQRVEAPPAPSSAPASVRPAQPVKTATSSGPAPSVESAISATDLIARGLSVFRNDLYEVGLFEGLNLLSVRQKGRQVIAQTSYQPTHVPMGANGKPAWKSLERLHVGQTTVARVNVAGGVRFSINQEGARVRAFHEITCLPDRIDVKTSVTPIDLVTGVEGRPFTTADWNWVGGLMPTGSKLKHTAESAYGEYNDGSVVRLVFAEGFNRLMTDTDLRARTSLHAYFSGNSQVRVHFNGTEPSTYGPLEMSVRFE